MHVRVGEFGRAKALKRTERLLFKRLTASRRGSQSAFCGVSHLLRASKTRSLLAPAYITLTVPQPFQYLPVRTNSVTPLPVRAEVLKPRHPVKPEVTDIRQPVAVTQDSLPEASLLKSVCDNRCRSCAKEPCHVSRRRRTSGMPGHWDHFWRNVQPVCTCAWARH